MRIALCIARRAVACLWRGAYFGERLVRRLSGTDDASVHEVRR